MSDFTIKSVAGIRNTLAAERLHNVPSRDLAAVDLVSALNVDIDDSGQVARRVGQTLGRANVAHSIWSNADQSICLFVDGTSLKRLMSVGGAVVTLATGLTAGLRMAYVEVNGKTYFSNGAQSGVIDGSVRSWGMAATGAPAVAAIAGTLEAGQYLAAYTLIRRDGQESGCTLPAKITLTAGQGVRFTWPAVTDADVDEVALWLSTPDGMVLYQAAVVPAAALTYDATGPAFALPLATQWLDAPPAGQCLAVHNGRIFIGAGAFVYATNALGFEHCDLRDYLALDGSAVRFIQGTTSGLYIGTAQAVYFVSGERLEAYALRVVSNAPAVIGSVVTANGAAVTGTEALSGVEVVLFTTADGVFMGLPDGTVANLTQERYRFAPGAEGCAVFRDEATRHQYLLVLPD